jgi:hypothetical protein
VTGAPIYLVSACASGEEFVAAFRRYADKNGLFVPISEPLPVGGRSRFALTLNDGGVMIEGEAEITSSARTASVLHGRVGMTLRFIEPDAASKTMLGELEKARLAMRPAPPSVAPRPAEIPAEPRPVPPPLQGRIDAVNALAECVAIGDTAALGPPLPPAPAPPPKAGPRFVAPALPATGLGVAPRTAAAPRPSTAPMPMVMPTPELRDMRDMRDTRDERKDARPPSITPRATPQPEALRKGLERRPDPAQAAVVPTVSGFSQTMTAVAATAVPAAVPVVTALPSGPTSDTIVAAAPPAPPVTPITPAAPPSAAPHAPTSDTITAAVPSPTTAAVPPPTTAAVPAQASVASPAAPRRAMEMPVAVPRSITRPGTPAPTLTPPVPRDRSISTTMTAVPVPAPSSTPQSAPTEIGGPIVDPLPPIEQDAEPVSDSAIEIVASTPARDDASARTQVHAGAPRPEPPASSSPVPAARPLPGSPMPVAPVLASVRPTMPEVEIAEPTDLWEGPPEPTPSLDPEGSTSLAGSLDPEGSTSLAESTSPGGSSSLEESTSPEPSTSPQRSTSPQESRSFEESPSLEEPPSLEESTSPEESPSLEESTSPEGSSSLEEATPSDAAVSRPRRTVIGVVITPPGVTVLPAAPKTQVTDAVAADDVDAIDPAGATGAAGDLVDGSLLAAEEPTGAERIVVGDSAVDYAAPTIRPEPAPWPSSETPAPSNRWTPARLAGRAVPAAVPPSPAAPVPAAPPATLVAPAPSVAPAAADTAPARGDWIMPPEKLAGLVVRGAEPVAPAPPAAVPPGLPSGDWTIALDPRAPDGWSEPFQLVSPHQLGDEPPPVAPPAVVANARPLDSTPRRPTPRPDEILATEPKVQIDPTLIEPLQSMPSDGLLRPMPPDGPSRPVPPEELFRSPAESSLNMPSYGAPPPATAIEAPPMNMMMAAPQQPPFMAPPGQPLMHPGQVPVYPMDAGYQMVPAGMSPQPFTAGGSGSGLVDPRYPSYPAFPVQTGRRHAIIVIVSALVAVVIGIIVLLVLGARHDPGPADSGSDKRGPPHAQAPRGSAIVPDPAQPAPPPPAGSSPAPGDPATKPSTVAAPASSATAPLTCFANVTSQPPGAEIVIDDTSVLGTTPQKIELPCGGPTEVVIRKARMVPVTRTVTPSPEGVTVKVALAKQTFLVKVSSTPPGATVTVNGKALGVTPTTVKVPAFETSILALAKDGYGPETEKVTPKTSGTALHTVLKKLDLKKPR